MPRRCIPERGERRPEAEWLAGRFEALREKYHLGNRTQTDRAVYERMYGHAPEKPADCLKIRYWRTGRHLPASREQCRLFGKALQLSGEVERFLIQGYCDRCDQAFEAETAGGAYQERIALLKELLTESS